MDALFHPWFKIVVENDKPATMLKHLGSSGIKFSFEEVNVPSDDE